MEGKGYLQRPTNSTLASQILWVGSAFHLRRCATQNGSTVMAVWVDHLHYIQKLITNGFGLTPREKIQEKRRLCS